MDEPDLASVDESGRALIPKGLTQRVDWLSGTEDVTVWLLMASFGRCRVVSKSDVDADADLAELIQRASRANAGPLAALEFDSEADAVFGYRVLETRVSYSLSKGRTSWRLRLPNAIITLWRLRPPDNEIALRFWGGYIEVWEPKTIKSAHRYPLSDFL